jgi:hypothetical protein
MRKFAALLAVLLVVGCQQSPPPQAPSTAAQSPPASPPAAPVTDQAAEKATTAVAKERLFPLDQDQFKQGAMGKTREQVHETYGQPDELGDWGPSVGWDGPVSIYRGPFTSGDGKSAADRRAKARVYFRKSGKDNVAHSVDFTNQ